MAQTISIAAFYAFTHLDADALTATRDRLHAFGKEHDMRGLVLLATEGINGTVCGTPEAIDGWKALLQDIFGPMTFNDSRANAHVFRSWYVKIREEVVTIGAPECGTQPTERHLSPEQWDAMLKENDVVVIDTRNTYETAIGMFEKAVDPKLKNFGDFPAYVRSAGIPKNKKVMMYCTGGIRCEKASVEMERQGYKDVYQLKGGILAYLQRFPQGTFDGECFVFDQRVSVDGRLRPSTRYGRCPHCGDPGGKKLECERCEKQCIVCERCEALEGGKTCSKNCRYHLRRIAGKIREK